MLKEIVECPDCRGTGIWGGCGCWECGGMDCGTCNSTGYIEKEIKKVKKRRISDNG